MANVPATAQMLLHAHSQTTIQTYVGPLDSSSDETSGPMKAVPELWKTKQGTFLHLADTYQDFAIPASPLDSPQEQIFNLLERSHTVQDREVRMAVLERAGGRCERCGYVASRPELLDLHHIISAGDKVDRLNNCVALCSNCHRETHLVAYAQAIEADLLKIAGQLRLESSGRSTKQDRAQNTLPQRKVDAENPASGDRGTAFGSEAAGSRLYFRGRLTKAVLMSLPQGLLLQRNVTEGPFEPIFEGVLGPVESRNVLWQVLRKLNVDGRTFCAYTTNESYDEEFSMRVRALKSSDVDG
jgi:hypothetical protein